MSRHKNKFHIHYYFQYTLQNKTTRRKVNNFSQRKMSYSDENRNNHQIVIKPNSKSFLRRWFCLREHGRTSLTAPSYCESVTLPLLNRCCRKMARRWHYPPTLDEKDCSRILSALPTFDNVFIIAFPALGCSPVSRD